MLSGGGARGAAHVGVLEVLEEERVPVDFVVGTSMGSIIGGLYASGRSPEEMVAIIESADWSRILSDTPPRDELWFRRRQDDRRFQVGVELGWSEGGPVLPPGMILGLNTEEFLEELMPTLDTPSDFDRLRIPFRCVATDVADGSAVVLDRGSLPRAIRASMSLPGIFAPVPHQGRVLVDGGVVDNVPVGVARSMGADVVIAVDISTPLGDPSSLRSLLSVSDQVIGIMMSENRRRSMESLTERDVAIVPDLDDIGVMAFDRSTTAIEKGREAAGALREAFAGLSVSEEEWAEWVGRQRRPAGVEPRLRHVIVEGETGFSDEVVRRVSGLRTGSVLSAEALSRARRRLAGLGVFERVDVEPVEGRPGEADAVLRPTEKRWGPHYLRFRLGATSDLRGSGDFDVGVQHTWTPLNELGGEWRNEVELGTRTRAFTEFYQPLDADLRWFVAPSIQYEQDVIPLIVNQQKVAEVSIDALEAHVDLGRNLGSWGEARVGYGWMTGTARPETALPGTLPGRTDVDRAQIRAQLAADTMDDINFPRSGILGFARWEFSDEALGGDDRRSALEAFVGGPLTWGPVTVVPSFEGGTLLEGGANVGGEFFLGGFRRLSGLELRELSGNHYALAVTQAYYQFTDRTTQFGYRSYLGASLELGGIWQDRDDVELDDMLLAGSVYFGLDSLLGPIYLGFGAAEGGSRSAYLFISPTI